MARPESLYNLTYLMAGENSPGNRLISAKNFRSILSRGTMNLGGMDMGGYATDNLLDNMARNLCWPDWEALLEISTRAAPPCRGLERLKTSLVHEYKKYITLALFLKDPPHFHFNLLHLDDLGPRLFQQGCCKIGFWSAP